MLSSICFLCVSSLTSNLEWCISNLNEICVSCQWVYYLNSSSLTILCNNTDCFSSAFAAREENLHQLPPSALLLDWQLGGAHHGGHPQDGGGDAERAGRGEDNDIMVWSTYNFSSIAFAPAHPWQTSLFPAVQIMKRYSFHILVYSWMSLKV